MPVLHFVTGGIIYREVLHKEIDPILLTSARRHERLP
jgi:hypothetical protein